MGLPLMLLVLEAKLILWQCWEPQPWQASREGRGRHRPELGRVAAQLLCCPGKFSAVCLWKECSGSEINPNLPPVWQCGLLPADKDAWFRQPSRLPGALECPQLAAFSGKGIAATCSVWSRWWLAVQWGCNGGRGSRKDGKVDWQFILCFRHRAALTLWEHLFPVQSWDPSGLEGTNFAWLMYLRLLKGAAQIACPQESSSQAPTGESLPRAGVCGVLRGLCIHIMLLCGPRIRR